MYHWRNAVGIAAAFIIVGLIYWWAQGYGPISVMDLTGVTLLIATGAAMGFAFFILLRGSGEL